VTQNGLSVLCYSYNGGVAWVSVFSGISDTIGTCHPNALSVVRLEMFEQLVRAFAAVKVSPTDEGILLPFTSLDGSNEHRLSLVTDKSLTLVQLLPNKLMLVPPANPVDSRGSPLSWGRFDPVVLTTTVGKNFVAGIVGYSPMMLFMSAKPGWQCQPPGCAVTFPCPAGFFRSSAGDLSPCMPCPTQTYAPHPSSVSCTPCDSDDENITCPLGSTRPYSKTETSGTSRTEISFPGVNNERLSNTQLIYNQILPIKGEGGSWIYFVSVICISAALLLLVLFICGLQSKRRAPTYVFCWQCPPSRLC
jgi:hypothetical protein